MSDDDDTGHQHSKIVSAVKGAAAKKFSVPVWALVAIAALAWAAGRFL